jgi:ABC-type phosphonate transport system ATPase subunit
MNTGLATAAVLILAALIDFWMSYRRAHVLMVLHLEWDREEAEPLTSDVQLVLKQSRCMDSAIMERILEDYVVPPTRFTVVLKLPLNRAELKIWRNHATDVALSRQAEHE